MFITNGSLFKIYLSYTNLMHSRNKIDFVNLVKTLKSKISSLKFETQERIFGHIKKSCSLFLWFSFFLCSRKVMDQQGHTLSYSTLWHHNAHIRSFCCIRYRVYYRTPLFLDT